MTIFERLRTEWLKADTVVNGGADPRAIAAFESKHRVTLPLEFKNYLLTVNGMAEGATDEDLVSFLSLDAIDRELTDSQPPAAFRDVMFAEYLVYSHVYVLRIAASCEQSPVLAADGEHQRLVSDSFMEFIEAYLANRKTVVHCWAKARPDGADMADRPQSR
ncbi:MAG TPA: SMI1/KNR4 family protein [Pirellulales bacterium]